MEMNNEELEQACNIDERETTIALMPKWLAELDLINLFIQRKKEIEEKIKVGIKTIGEYDCQIFSIKNKHEEKTIIKESKTISEDLNKKLDEFKKLAEENNDLGLLEKINSIKDDFDNDKKVSYAKPQAKIKELFRQFLFRCNPNIPGVVLVYSHFKLSPPKNKLPLYSY